MRRRWQFIMLLLLLSLALAGCAKKTAWQQLMGTADPNWTPGPGDYSYRTPAPAEGAEGNPNKLFTTDVEQMDAPHIVVYKSRNVLEVWDGDTLMARMRAAMGKVDGAKEKSGDNKTPEGQYYVCKLSEQGRYYKSFFFSYPNADDALAGLNDEKITQNQYDEITAAIDGRETPPWDTKLGGEIAISGTGTIGKDQEGNWTGGNVAVSDKDMDYLWKYITVGVDVEINP